MNNCVYCGKELNPERFGKAITNHGEICQQCAATINSKEMLDSGRATLYYTSEGIMDWMGGLRFKKTASKYANHNIAGRVLYVWFKDHTGANWLGKQYGVQSDLLYCKRLKQ